MITADRIPEIQQSIAEHGHDGWLFCCFQLNDPISLGFLGLGGDHLVTRRCYYLIPRQGEPSKLAHRLEPAMLDHLPGRGTTYLTWQEHRTRLAELVAGTPRLAVQYSAENQLPSVSRLDAGTAELLRATGCHLASSAELVQLFAAVWSDEQLASHRRAAVALHEIVHAAFAHVGEAFRADRGLDERQVQRFILDAFAARGLWSESSPIVAVNAHAADPHYQPAAEGSAVICRGDLLLIDLWAKERPTHSIYADITWCGVCSTAPEARHAEVFAVVAAARDAAWELVAGRFPDSTVRGFEVDDAAREVIRAAGYGDAFFHRTGHSIDTADHGQGANMDNLETHDVRPLIAGTGFSIEPGIYLAGDFGVRSEINVHLTATGAAISGGTPQRELIRVLG